MDEDGKKLKIKEGTCENCFMVEVSPKTEVCPVCKTPNPYMPVENAIQVSVHSRYGLRAVGFLVKFKGWTVSKAIEYCKNIDTGLDLAIVPALDDLIEHMVKNDQKVMLTKLVRELSPAQFGWDLRKASEFVDIMFPDMRANRRNTEDSKQ